MIQRQEGSQKFLNSSLKSLMLNMKNYSGFELDNSFTEKSLSYVNTFFLLISIGNCLLLRFEHRANFSWNFISLVSCRSISRAKEGKIQSVAYLTPKLMFYYS